MLSITRKADYALIAMTDLVDQYPAVVRTREMSERRRIPIPVLRKILSMLATRKLVVSIRTRTGGFRLARSPEDITVAEVIAAIEGSFRFADCTGRLEGRRGSKCEQKVACTAVGSMHKIHALLEQCLTGVSLEEFASNAVPDSVTLKRATRKPKRKRTEAAAQR